MLLTVVLVRLELEMDRMWTPLARLYLCTVEGWDRVECVVALLVVGVEVLVACCMGLRVVVTVEVILLCVVWEVMVRDMMVEMLFVMMVLMM